MAGITPFLWFDDGAEQAAEQYVSIFTDAGRTDSGVTHVTRYGPAGSDAAGRPEGSVMTVAFRLNGQDIVALNGGPEFRFTEAFSLVVSCETQEEIDHFWERLSEGGEQGPCGWLKDRYGLSWQVVPTVLDEMIRDEDPEKAERVMAAMLQMKKIEIEGLREAYERA
jgi:predicted 3-demethylubiquinone-9 3-methyltransferase (glyoxalase superfamily)